MRYILLIAFLFLVCNGYGQNEEVNTTYYDTAFSSATLTGIDSGGTITWGGAARAFLLKPLNVQAHTVIYDTIPCIMLVCDTGYKKGFDKSFIVYSTNDSTENIGKCEHCVAYVFWMKGYEVREKHYYNNGRMRLNADGIIMPDCYTHKEYLDADKKQLPKNIIVWQSK